MLVSRRSLEFVRSSYSRGNVKHLYVAATSRANATNAEQGIAEANQNKDVQTSTLGGKLPARAPLVKEFFLGKVDKELLAFPEPLSREELAKLKNEVMPFKQFFSELEVSNINATQTIASQVLENVKELGLFAINVPLVFNGKGWGWTQSLFASEAETECTDIALQLLSHRVVIDLLSKQGSTLQQQRFLPALAKGSSVATEAIFELEAAENEIFNTTADYNATTRTWTLNGHKAFVITGPLVTGASTLFLVIAQTQLPNLKRDMGRSTTVFLVDSDKSGVKLGEQHFTIGCRGVQMRSVQFDSVTLTDDCVIGEPHSGNIPADTLLEASRLRNSILGLGISKNILNELASYCRNNGYLKDTEMMKVHLSKAMCSVYSMESIIYLTAGLLDEFNGQDVALECALTKYYVLTRTFKLAKKYLDIIGPKSLHSGETSEIMFRNTAQLYTQGETIDTLRLQIALMGFQYAGRYMGDSVQKMRNPLFHPTHIFSKFMQTSSIDTPKTKMQLGEHLHPSLEPAAQCIEQSIARLQMCVELMFARYGNELIEHHSEMERIAEISSTIYSMFASASRASRSYCIGLPLSDHEMLTATAICSRGNAVVYTLAKEIFNGHYENNDNNLNRLANQVVKNGYFATHPLTFNF